MKYIDDFQNEKEVPSLLQNRTGFYDWTQKGEFQVLANFNFLVKKQAMRYLRILSKGKYTANSSKKYSKSFIEGELLKFGIESKIR